MEKQNWKITHLIIDIYIMLFTMFIDMHVKALQYCLDTFGDNIEKYVVPFCLLYK